MADGSISLASLGVRIDATQVDAATQAFDRNVAAGARMEGQVGRIASTSEKAAGSVRKTADAASRAESALAEMGRSIADADAKLRRAAQADEAFVRANASLDTTVRKLNASWDALWQEHDFAREWNRATSAALAHDKALEKVAGKFKLTAAQATNLSYQLNDVITGLISGQAPAQVLAQQGGQLFQIMQQGAASSGLSLGALVGSIGLTAGAVTGLTVGVGLLGAAFLAGQADADRFANAMKATGDYAGLTGGQFEAAVGRIADAAHTGFGEARAAMQTLVSSGQFTGQTVELLAASVVDLSQKTGRSAGEMASYFAGMGDDVYGFAVKFNSSYHQLTAAQIEHIRLLQEQGDVTGAQLALAISLHQRLGEEGPASLGYLEIAWKAVGGAISDAWNALKGFGNESLRAPQALQHARDNLAVAQTYAANNPNSEIAKASLAAAKAEVQALEAAQKAQEDKAKSDAAAAQTTDRATQAQQRMNGQWASGADSLTKYHADLKLYEDDLKALSAAGLKLPTADEQASARAAIYKRDMPQAAAAAQRAETASGSAARAAQRHAEQIARDAEAMVATTAATLALAEAYAKSDAAALAAAARVEAVGKAIKDRGDIEAYVQRQLDLNAAKAAAQGAKDLSDIRFQTETRKRLYDAVAAGTMTQVAANEQLALETQLRPLQAARDAASGEAKVALTKIIQDLTKATADLNSENRRDALASANQQQEDQIDLLQKQLDLVGATNTARAIEIAQLQARQAIIAAGGDPNSAEGRAKISGAGQAAALSSDVQTAQDNYNASLNATLDLLSDIEAMSTQAGANIADAFGDAGKAVGGLTTALIRGARVQEQLDRQRQEAIKKAQVSQYASAEAQRASAQQIGRIEVQYARDSASARIQGYGDMAGAAKSFFDENSKGYKALQIVEQTFRAAEMALTLASFIQRQTFTATDVAAVTAGEAAKATATVAASGVMVAANTAVGASAAAAGVATQAMGDPYTAFARVAAMAAIMAGLGFAVFGGGGGSGTGLGYSVADRQKAQGTGSVLGDAEAKSDSISRSLSLVADHTNKSLEYSNGMLRALRSIDDQISVVATALAKTLSVGGALSTSNLNLGTTTGKATGGQLAAAAVGGGVIGLALTQLLPGLFGTKTTRTLADQGLQFQGQTLGDLLSNGVAGSTYQTVSTNTKKKFLGFTYSDKTTASTTTQDLSSDLQQQITLLISDLKSGVLSAASVLGITGADEVLNAFQVELGQISLKDMTSQEITDTLNAVFSKLGDDMAGAAVAGLSEFQKAGEGLFETLSRVAKDYQVVDVTLKSVGLTFKAVGLASVGARERLIDLAGGLDDFTQQAADFADAFLTKDEQIAPVIRAVSDEMARLGLSGVKTKQQFKDLVRSLDVSTEAGAETYAALMKVAPAFAQVADYFDQLAGVANDNVSLTDQLSAARSALADAYDNEASAIQDTISRFKDFANSLKKFKEGLYTGPRAMLSPEDQYKAAKAAFEDTRSKALAGDQSAIGDLQSVSEAYLDASKEYYASSESYFKDLEAVRQAVASTEDLAQSQVEAAQVQLDLLRQQVSQLITLNDSVLSVRDAISALKVLQAQAAQAAQVSTTSTTSTTATSSGSSFNGSSYLTANPDVAAAYQDYLAGTGPYSWAYASGLSAAEFAKAHYDMQGKYEGRVGFATGGSFMVGGAGGVDSQEIKFNATPGEKVKVSRPGVNDNERVEALLSQVLEELRADKVQRGAAASATVDALDEVRSEVRAVRRAVAKPQ